MSSALVALALAAVWSDASGRLRCDVPDGYAALPAEPWRFARADGLRQLVFLTVKPVSSGPQQRARQLLERTGASAVSDIGTDAVLGQLDPSPALAAALAIASVQPTWAGVLVLGPPAADVANEARALAGKCRTVMPAFANGRVYDTTRRLSAAIPAGHQAVEIRGAGAVQGDGYTIRVTAVQPKSKDSLQDVAAEMLAPSGAKLESTAGASAGPNDLPVVIATGTLAQNGVDYLIEIAAIDLGDGEVGGLGLSANAAATSRARGAMEDMLRTVTVSPKP